MRVKIPVMVALVLACATAPAGAALIQVSLNTAPLIGGATGPYSINFQLVDGDGSVNNSVVLSNFSFGGGAAGAGPLLSGDASGDLGSSITLGDGAFFNDFIQEFTPGATLAFDVSFTTNFVAPTPDRFTFAILNAALVEVPTLGAGNELLGIDLRSPIAVEVYAGADIGSGDPLLAAPTVTSAPEPAGLMLLALGGWAFARRSRRLN